MRLLTFILIVLALPFAAACGGGDDSSSNTSAQTGGGGGGGGQTVDLTATDFHFSPPAITVDAGTVTFVLTNNGGSSHALTIEGNGVDESSDTIGPGDSTELTVDLTEGEYQIFCPVGNHADMGMVGTVTVGAASAGGGGEDDGGGSPGMGSGY
jgi:plastocyanin